MRELATKADAMPLSNQSNVSYASPWDQRIGVACYCDSSWPVGLGPGQRQDREYFGPDCSKRHCPSGNDVNTARDETDCFSNNSNAGNLCHVDCSNRGICNHKRGECKCFDGYRGSACEKRRR